MLITSKDASGYALDHCEGVLIPDFFHLNSYPNNIPPQFSLRLKLPGHFSHTSTEIERHRGTAIN